MVATGEAGRIPYNGRWSDGMLLAVDIGNTNITFGVFDGDSIEATWRMATEVHRQTDEYAALCMTLLSYYGVPLKALDKGIVSSVVPPLTHTFEEFFERYLDIKAMVVGAGIKTGMRILYESPRDVGADRVVQAVAANRLYGAPVIVLDFGTTTVLDAVNEHGDYLGGAIAPGINLAAEALYERASKLPRIEVARPPTAIGRNTVASMQSGLYFGYIGLIEGLVTRFQRELGGAAKVVATGGLSFHIVDDTKLIDEVNDDLLLLGLRMIHEMNESRS